MGPANPADTYFTGALEREREAGRGLCVLEEGRGGLGTTRMPLA